MTDAISKLVGEASAARHRAWVEEKKLVLLRQKTDLMLAGLEPESETREAEIEEMRREE